MSNRGMLAFLSIAAPLAWGGLAYTVLNVSPDETPGRVVFFVLFYVALAGTVGLAAYFLSFRLFASKMYRGNAILCAQQGLLLATFAVLASLLQATRVLSIMAAAILLAALVVAEFVALGRRGISR